MWAAFVRRANARSSGQMRGGGGSGARFRPGRRSRTRGRVWSGRRPAAKCSGLANAITAAHEVIPTQAPCADGSHDGVPWLVGTFAFARELAEWQPGPAGECSRCADISWDDTRCDGQNATAPPSESWASARVAKIAVNRRRICTPERCDWLRPASVSRCLTSCTRNPESP
jgi:hypothetical protein